jgi:hypothetical protein
MLEKIQKNPVLLTSALRSLIAAAGAFGFELTGEQMFALMAALEAILALFTREAVTPNINVQRKVEERVAHRELTGQTATGIGMSPPPVA